MARNGARGLGGGPMARPPGQSGTDIVDQILRAIDAIGKYFVDVSSLRGDMSSRLAGLQDQGNEIVKLLQEIVYRLDGPTVVDIRSRRAQATDTRTDRIPDASTSTVQHIEFKGRGHSGRFVVVVDGATVKLTKTPYSLALELALRRLLYGDDHKAYLQTGKDLWRFAGLSRVFWDEANCQILADEGTGEGQRRINCAPSAVVIDVARHRSMGRVDLSKKVRDLLEELASRKPAA